MEYHSKISIHFDYSKIFLSGQHRGIHLASASAARLRTAPHPYDFSNRPLSQVPGALRLVYVSSDNLTAVQPITSASLLRTAQCRRLSPYEWLTAHTAGQISDIVHSRLTGPVHIAPAQLIAKATRKALTNHYPARRLAPTHYTFRTARTPT